MKVLAVCGSPRKGNTEAMLREVLKGAKSEGAETGLVLLRDLEIKHCDGCLSCIRTKECHIQDDMQDLYREMENADVFVFGSPNYYENVTGLFKDFIDRTNPFYMNKKVEGKIAILIAIGGISAQDVIRAMRDFCKANRIKVVAEIVSKADKPGEILKDRKKVQECFGLGKGLVRD